MPRTTSDLIDEVERLVTNANALNTHQDNAERMLMTSVVLLLGDIALSLDVIAATATGR